MTLTSDAIDPAELAATFEQLVVPAERLDELEKTRRAEDLDRRLLAAKLPRRALEWWLAQPTFAAGDPWLAARDGLAALMQRGSVVTAIAGHSGRGKTTLATAVALAELGRGKTVQWITAVRLHALLSDAKARAGNRDAFGLAETLAQLSEAHLLVIDQYEKLQGATWEERYVFDVVDARYNDGSNTLLVLNVPTDTENTVDKLCGAARVVLGESMVQRVEESGGVLACAWERKRK